MQRGRYVISGFWTLYPQLIPEYAGRTYVLVVGAASVHVLDTACFDITVLHY